MLVAIMWLLPDRRIEKELEQGEALMRNNDATTCSVFGVGFALMEKQRGL